MFQVEVLTTLLGIGLFVAVIYGPWQWYLADECRQDLFEIRDRLFDMALEGRLSFKSSEYRMLRAGLNAQIRFAHQATWPRLVLFWLFVGRHEDLAKASSMTAALECIKDEVVRKEVGVLLASATVSIIRMMFWRSPVAITLAMLVLPIIFLVSQCFSATKELNRTVRGRLKSISGPVIQYEAEHFAV